VSSYLMGTDAIAGLGLPGAPGTSTSGDQYLVIHVKNVPDLVRAQGGKSGGIAFQVAPQTITNKVYEEMRAKIVAGFKSEGVDADAYVTMTPPVGAAPRDEFLRGVAAGGAAVGVGWLLWTYVIRGLFGGSR
jgi:hypothetical protein